MTKPIYDIVSNPNGNESIQMTDLNGKIWSIPMDESNADYQTYLESLNEPVTKSK